MLELVTEGYKHRFAIQTEGVSGRENVKMPCEAPVMG
jgi:hypothetical protein